MLVSLATGWLREGHPAHLLMLVAIGVLAALLIHHFGFLRVVDKNLGRILPMEGARCVFSFMSWKSYIVVAFMMAMGVGLRHSPIPKPYLAVLYVGIGLALILSSIRYLRVKERDVHEKPTCSRFPPSDKTRDDRPGPSIDK